MYWFIDMLNTIFYKIIFCDMVIISTWYKMRHKFSNEHNRLKTRTLHPSIMVKRNSLKPNYANLMIKNNKIVYELWHNCSGYGHHIEHNRKLF